MAKREDEIVDSLAGDEGGVVWSLGLSELPKRGRGGNKMDPVKGNIVICCPYQPGDFYLRLHPSNKD